MLEFLGDALGAIISGGATGLLGSVATGLLEYKKTQLMLSHEKDMAKIEQDNIRLENEGKIHIADAEAEAQRYTADSNLMAESFKHDAAKYYTGKLGPIGRFFMVFVDFCRGMIRPSMTVFMTGLTFKLYLDVMDLLNGIGGGAFDPDTLLALAKQIILVILYITTTCALWWFGTRHKIIRPQT